MEMARRMVRALRSGSSVLLRTLSEGAETQDMFQPGNHEVMVDECTQFSQGATIRGQRRLNKHSVMPDRLSRHWTNKGKWRINTKPKVSNEKTNHISYCALVLNACSSSSGTRSNSSTDLLMARLQRIIPTPVTPRTARIQPTIATVPMEPTQRN